MRALERARAHAEARTHAEARDSMQALMRSSWQDQESPSLWD
jgi:hypothetical protein